MKRIMIYSDALKNMKHCPFCKIEKHHILAENEHAIIMPSRAPHAPNHLLVFPKKHALSVSELNEEELASFFEIAGNMMKNSKYPKEFNLLYREGKSVGKTIDHMHINLIPEKQVHVVGIDESKRQFLSEEDYLNLTKRLKNEYFN